MTTIYQQRGMTGHGVVSSQQPVSASGVFKTLDGKTVEIRDVWASNLEKEMENIRELLDGKFRFVSMVSPVVLVSRYFRRNGFLTFRISFITL